MRAPGMAEKVLALLYSTAVHNSFLLEGQIEEGKGKKKVVPNYSDSLAPVFLNKSHAFKTD
jgi:uncharacterized lipoprotein NlpE involved in copper resistance